MGYYGRGCYVRSRCRCSSRGLAHHGGCGGPAASTHSYCDSSSACCPGTLRRPDWNGCAGVTRGLRLGGGQGG